MSWPIYVGITGIPVYSFEELEREMKREFKCMLWGAVSSTVIMCGVLLWCLY